MSLENEYLHWKQLIENEEKKLAKFEAIDTSDKDEDQLAARERGIKRVKSSIEEYSEILEEIENELKEFIKNGGEVSQSTIEELAEADKSDKFDDDETVEFGVYYKEVDQYVSPDYPNLIFSTVEAAKSFAKKLNFKEYNVVEYLYLTNDETETKFIGYAILINERLFQ